jgi:hypothetical protein
MPQHAHRAVAENLVPGTGVPRLEAIEEEDVVEAEPVQRIGQAAFGRVGEAEYLLTVATSVGVAVAQLRVGTDQVLPGVDDPVPIGV